MSSAVNIDLATDIQANLIMILEENQKLANQIDFDQVADMIPFIQNAERIFIVAQEELVWL